MIKQGRVSILLFCLGFELSPTLQSRQRALCPVLPLSANLIFFSTPALRWHAPECRSTHLEIQKPYGSVDTQPLQQQCGPCKRAGQSLPTPGGSILGQLPRHRGRMAVHVAPTLCQV